MKKKFRIYPSEYFVLLLLIMVLTVMVGIIIRGLC